MFTGVYKTSQQQSHLTKMQARTFSCAQQHDVVEQLSHDGFQVSFSKRSCQQQSSTISNVPPPRKFIRQRDGKLRTVDAASDYLADKIEFIIACKQVIGREIVNFESAQWGQQSEPVEPSASRRECSRAG